MSEALVVGIDCATRDVRVVCVDARGGVLAEVTRELPPPLRPAPGHSEQDARSWWPALAAALRELTALLGSDRRRIVAVAPAATSGTIVLVDCDGEPLGPALLYDDARARTEAERAQRLGEARWERAGLQIGPSFALAKLAWLAGRPQGLEGAAHAWSAADLIVARLLGRPGPSDWSHALKTGYDPVERSWAYDVLDALRIPASLLPTVERPTHLAGALGEAAADETGLPRNCQVRLGMTDGCAAQLASGPALPGSFVSVLGTTLVVKGVSRALLHDPSGAIYSHLHPDGWWLPGGASNTGGDALRRYPRGSLAELDGEAASFGPASVVAYPLRREGERFPFCEPLAHGFVLGRASDEREGYRAALEGVAFVERLAYDRLASLGAVIDGQIGSAGAAGASRTWSTIRATVLGRPLVRAATPTTAFGAALLAAAGTLYPTLEEAAAAMVRPAATVEPDPAEAGALEQSYGRFVAELTRRGWLADRA
jgi:sugar (pentulose or hexulose) kinase